MINAQPRERQSRRHLHLELWLVGAAAVVLAFALAIYAPGGPLSSDVLAYIDIGLHNAAVPNFLNRYFHIFLQKAFMGLARSPFQGIQAYWAFLISGTALLTYASARTYRDRSGPIHGLLGVALLLSYNALGDDTGITYADCTAMFMVMLVITVFLQSARKLHRKAWLVGLLGFLFFLGVKAKETVLPLAILFPALAFSEDGFDRRLFARNLLWLTCGLAAGIAAMSAWSYAVLGDPLFGLKPADLRQFLDTYFRAAVVTPLPRTSDWSWLAHAFAPPLFVQSLLFVVSGIGLAGQASLSQYLVMLAPLGTVLFLTLTINNFFGFEPRFFLPAVPVLCALAPQFLEFAPVSGDKARRLAIALFAGGCLAVGLLGGSLFLLLRHEWGLGLFLSVIFYPLVWSALLALVFAKGLRPDRKAIIALALVLALISPPLARNVKVMFIERPNEAITRGILYPPSAFADRIHLSPDVRLSIASGVWEAVGASFMRPTLTEDMGATAILWRLASHAEASAENFVDSVPLVLGAEEILGAGTRYVMITRDNWDTLATESQQAIAVQYDVSFDERGILVLLSSK